MGNPAFAGPTGVFGTMGDNHPELGGDDVQPFTDIFANDMALSPADTKLFRFDDHLNPFQMLGQ